MCLSKNNIILSFAFFSFSCFSNIFSFHSAVNVMFNILCNCKEFPDKGHIIREKGIIKPEGVQVCIEHRELERTISNFKGLVEGQLEGNSIDIRELVGSEKSYVQKVLINDGDNVLVVGDFHGSVHSLIRNLLDWIALGYLNLDFRLAPNVKVVCLGDYIDRGRYGVEVLYLLMSLNLMNPEQVVLLRGNHECAGIASLYGFSDEVGTKYYDKDLNIEDRWEIRDLYESFDLYKLFLSSFDLLPTVLILDKNGERIMCCHGCGPFDVEYGEYDFVTNLRSIEKFSLEEEAEASIRFVLGARENFFELIPNSSQTTWGEIFPGRVVCKTSRGCGNVIGADLIRDCLATMGIRFIFHGHKHNNAAVSIWVGTDDKRIIKRESFTETFPINSHFDYTFMSGPEGLGGESTFENSNVDGFGILRIKGCFDEWILIPCERKVGNWAIDSGCIVRQDWPLGFGKFVHVDVEGGRLVYDWRDYCRQKDFSRVINFLRPGLPPLHDFSLLDQTSYAVWRALYGDQ